MLIETHHAVRALPDEAHLLTLFAQLPQTPVKDGYVRLGLRSVDAQLRMAISLDLAEELGGVEKILFENGYYRRHSRGEARQGRPAVERRRFIRPDDYDLIFCLITNMA